MKKEQPTIHYNVREERLKQNQNKKSCIDEVKENAKKHFEEIFNRI
jgi:hypothetical protein